MRVRSAGPWISKLRKRVLARKRERVSSMGSYEGWLPSIVEEVSPGERGGRVCAGPRVRVRRGRRAMLAVFCVSVVVCSEAGGSGGLGREGVVTDGLLVRLV